MRDEKLRDRLREPGPYVAAVVATLVFLPVLLWNSRHEWISFAFQLQHGLGTARGSALLRELDLVGGQAGLASPILFVMMAIAVARASHPLDAKSPERAAPSPSSRSDARLLRLQRAAQAPEANWPAPAYIPATVLVATHPWGERGRRWLRAGWIFAVVLTLIVYLHALVPVLPIPPRKDPIAKAFGWGRVAAVVAAARVSAASRRRSTSAPTVTRMRRRSPSPRAHTRRRRRNATGRGHVRLRREPERAPQPVRPLARFPDVARPGDDLLLVLDDGDDFHSAPGASHHSS